MSPIGDKTSVWALLRRPRLRGVQTLTVCCYFGFGGAFPHYGHQGSFAHSLNVIERFLNLRTN